MSGAGLNEEHRKNNAGGFAKIMSSSIKDNVGRLLSKELIKQDMWHN